MDDLSENDLIPVNGQFPRAVNYLFISQLEILIKFLI